MEPDSIGLEGGSNPYAYALNNPIMYVDMTGAIPVPIITGAIGGVAGGGASIFAQLATNGTKGFSWKSVGVAAGVGAIAGAVSPWTAQTAIGAVITGSAASSAQYGVTQYVTKQPATIQGYTASAILGGIGGGVAGAVPKSNLIRVDTNSIFIPRAEAIRANNIADVRAVTTKNSFIANFSGAAVSADMGGLGTKVINNGIDYTQRHINLQSNQMMLDIPYRSFNQNEYKGTFLMPTLMIKATQ